MSSDFVVSSRGPDTAGPESIRKDTRLLLVSNDAMRARRRPIAIFAYYIYQLAVSLLVAWPLSQALAAAFGGHPRGDAVLFDEGSWALLAARSAWDRASPAITGALLLAIVLGAVLGLVPLSALLTSISHATPETRAPRPRHLAPYVVASFPPLVSLLALGSAIELVLLAVSAWAFGAVRDSLEPRYGDPRADQIGVVVLLLLLLVVAAVYVVHDLARAAVIRYRAGAIGALRSALLTFRRAPFRMLWSWAWRGSISLALVVLVALVVPHLGDRGMRSILAIGAIHQLVVLARTGLRASWLARALRGVDRFGSKRGR